MRKMGLQGITPKKNLSWPNKAHPVYPYLLKGLDITRPSQVFCADITYIPMRKGFKSWTGTAGMWSPGKYR
jgi:putative transposase